MKAYFHNAFLATRAYYPERLSMMYRQALASLPRLSRREFDDFLLGSRFHSYQEKGPSQWAIQGGGREALVELGLMRGHIRVFKSGAFTFYRGSDQRQIPQNRIHPAQNRPRHAVDSPEFLASPTGAFLRSHSQDEQQAITERVWRLTPWIYPRQVEQAFLMQKWVVDNLGQKRFGNAGPPGDSRKYWRCSLGNGITDLLCLMERAVGNRWRIRDVNVHSLVPWN